MLVVLLRCLVLSAMVLQTLWLRWGDVSGVCGVSGGGFRVWLPAGCLTGCAAVLDGSCLATEAVWGCC